MNQNDYFTAILAIRPFAFIADYLFFLIEIGRHFFGLKKPSNQFYCTRRLEVSDIDLR